MRKDERNDEDLRDDEIDDLLLNYDSKKDRPTYEVKDDKDKSLLIDDDKNTNYSGTEGPHVPGQDAGDLENNTNVSNSIDEEIIETTYPEDDVDPLHVEEKPEAKLSVKRVLMAGALVLFAVFAVFALIPDGSQNKSKSNSKSSVPSDQINQKESMGQDVDVDSLLSIETPSTNTISVQTDTTAIPTALGSNAIEEQALRAPADSTVGLTAMHLATAINLVDESGRLKEVATLTDIQNIQSSVHSLETKLDDQTNKIEVVEKSIKSIESSYQTSNKQLTDLKEKFNKEFNRYEGRRKPNIKILYTVESFGCPTCTAAAVIVDLHDGSEHSLAEGDTFNGYKVHVQGDRVVLINDEGTHSYAAEL